MFTKTTSALFFSILLFCSPKVIFSQLGELSTITNYSHVPSRAYHTPRHAYFEDLDNDGDIDLLIQPPYKYLFTWFENDGKGNFTEVKATKYHRKGFQHVVPKDIDGDGDIDLIHKNVGTPLEYLILHKNNGKGNFADTLVIFDKQKGGTNDKWLGTADLNNDGFIDFFFQRNNKILCLNGNKDFKFQKEILDINLPFNLKRMIVSDVNNDGLNDLILFTKKYLYQYQNFGENEFLRSAKIDFNYASSVQSFDVNNDGFSDLVRIDKNKHRLFENDKNWGYHEYGFPFSKSHINYYSYVLEDISGDGKKDFIYYNPVNHLTWSKYKKNGNLSKPKLIDTFKESKGWFSGVEELFVKDINGDDLPDIIGRSSHNFIWYENKGKGQFSGQKILIQFERKELTYLGDMDGDDYDDFILTDILGKGEISLKNGNPKQERVTPQPIISLEGIPITTKIADFDNDRDKDLLIIYNGKKQNWYTSSLSIHLNNENGIFKDKVRIYPHEPFSKFPEQQNDYRITSIGDLDNNGYNDLIYLNYQPNLRNISGKEAKLVFLPNKGSMEFAPEKTIAEFENIGSLDNSFLLDFNNDGHQDIFLFYDDSYENILLYLENDGTENFSNEELLSFESGVNRQLNFVDLDKDNFLDLVCISGYKKIEGTTSYIFHNTIVYYPNDNNGNFLEEIILLERPNIKLFKFVDIDKDKDLDLLVVASNDDKFRAPLIIEIYQNEEQNKFVLRETKKLEEGYYPVEISKASKDREISFIFFYEGQYHALEYQCPK